MTMKLAEALKTLQSSSPQAPPLHVALLCGFTPLHLETFFRAELVKLFPEYSPHIHPGLYGDLIGSLQQLEAVSSVVVVIEWSDLDPRLGLRRLGGWEPSQLPDVLDQVHRTAERLRSAMSAVALTIPLVVSFPTLPLVPISFAPLSQASEFTLELHSAVASLAAALSHVAGIRIIDSQRLNAISPRPRLDVTSDLSAGFPFTLTHASALADLLARLVVNPQPKKGLITDLDDTLWRGILGDVGVQGISWDLDNHSQIHALYQQLLRSLAASGTLIAVASKNDRPLVDEVFATRESILLKNDVFPFEVHWGAKSESVSRILTAWNISADDVVCVDDSPMDLAEIKAAHPGTECLLFPRHDPQRAYDLLEHLRDLFGKSNISAEDSLRAASLRANASVPSATQSTDPIVMARFVRELEGQLTMSSQKQPFDPRALELVNKTNQFNLNGRRVLEADWRAWLNSANSVFVTATYRDKYGPLGKIAVIAGHLTGDDSAKARTLCIRTWVMSCRAFSRFIEHECLRWLFDEFDVEEMELEFSPTPRNTPMRHFLQKVLETPPESSCRLSRSQFMHNCPDPTHAVEGSRNG